MTDAYTGKKYHSSYRFTVHTSAPKAAFHVSKSVLMRGERIALEDISRYAPTSREWLLSCHQDTLRAKGKHAEFHMDTPGVYDLTLVSKNEAGTDTAHSDRTVIVCNADSKNGLNFSRNEAEIHTTSSPMQDSLSHALLAWWMSPSSEGPCAGIGEADSTWRVSVNRQNEMVLTVRGKHVKSKKGFVLRNGWHHYAVRFDEGCIAFMRDGECLALDTLKRSKTLPALTTFRMGGKAHPVNAVVDEVSLWAQSPDILTLRRMANRPLSELNEEEKTGLILYYDFNQNGGNVQDRSNNKLDAIRTDFGPDGDAWGLSTGVFCLPYTQENGYGLPTGTDNTKSTATPQPMHKDKKKRKKSGNLQ